MELRFSAGVIVKKHILPSTSLLYDYSCGRVYLETVTANQQLGPRWPNSSKYTALSCASRDLSLGLETSRDSFFEVLILVTLLVLFVGHKISASKWRWTLVGRGRHNCFDTGASPIIRRILWYKRKQQHNVSNDFFNQSVMDLCFWWTFYDLWNWNSENVNDCWKHSSPLLLTQHRITNCVYSKTTYLLTYLLTDVNWTREQS